MIILIMLVGSLKKKKKMLVGIFFLGAKMLVGILVCIYIIIGFKSGPIYIRKKKVTFFFFFEKKKRANL